MLPITSSVGTRLKLWNTKPTRRRRSTVRAASSRLVMSVEPSHTRPEVAESRPAMMCMRVDLPEPLGPMIAVNSPRLMPMETPESAATGLSALPYDFERSSTRATSPLD
jgi:hypothetical protein